MSVHAHDESCVDDHRGVHSPVRPKTGGWRAILDGLGTAVGVILGLAPHVLHHIGLFAGAALITGASGNALFYVVGLVLSVPMLLRLYRRFRTPWAPTLAIAVFTGLFSLSAFVIGPAISGTDDAPRSPVPTEPTPSPSGNHTEHHD